jgi:hypothetical protein
MFSYLKNLIIEVITNKYFWIGALIAIAAFSHYIFGNDNALEQLGEIVTKIFTGIETDFSPQP